MDIHSSEAGTNSDFIVQECIAKFNVQLFGGEVKELMWTN